MSSSWESIQQNFYTKLAQSIDPIDSTITFYAEILASGILKAKDKNGDDITDKSLIVNLLKNPNDNQNFIEFIKEWLYYLYSHGYTYQYPVSTSLGFEKKLNGNSKTSIYNLDPDSYTWKNDTSFFGLIKSKEIQFDYKPLQFANIGIKDVISYYDVRQNSAKPYTGVSRLLALKQQIQNYHLASQGEENLIKRSGSILVSLDAKTEDMGLDSSTGTGLFDKDGSPIMSTHKEKLEKELRETGLGNGSMGVMFSTLPLKSTPLSAGLENIKFNELMIQNARQILNKYNVPKEFQNLTVESAKFANRQMAMIEVVQNTVQPLGNSFCSKIMGYFNNIEEYIYLDYSHLPVFSENESTKISTQQAIVNLYSGLFEKHIITDADFKLILKEYGITK